ncbi:MAG: GntR family transcriptional regulator [Pelagimonas sp.]|uniref:GntR family transcriptional regulator n=1 Tax=Pelagimonas sp. TaxID=2073170 RepID=UPI003D6A6F3E
MTEKKLIEPARETQATQLTNRLRTDIVSCDIAPGEKLRMEFLREKYGAGGSPVREALNRLVAEGFVVQSDQRGFRAAPVSLDEMQDLTLARVWIGESALRASIQNGDDAWEDRVVLAFHRWERAQKRGMDVNSSEMHALHANLHREILSDCGSRRMLGFWDTSFDYAQRYQAMSQQAHHGQKRDTLKEHRDIMEAALDRDVETCARLHRAHLELTADIVKALESTFNPPDTDES